MKAVFPCKGVVVLTKKDIKTLENFYKKQLTTSENYNTTKSMLQIGNLNYLPPKTNIVINEENLLTLLQLRSMMENSVTQTKIASSEQKSNNEIFQKPISDDDILSHPFFTTLKPLN